MHDTGESTLVGAKGAATRASPGAEDGPRLVAWTLLAHPDVSRVGERAVLGELDAGVTAELSRRRPDFSVPGSPAGRPLEDRYLSRQPVTIEASEDGWRISNQATPMAMRLDGQPVRGSVWLGSDALDRGVVIELVDRIVLLLHRVRARTEPDVHLDGWVGASEALTDLKREILRVADQPVSVLVRGETGSGKELVANALHTLSGRADRPFVAVHVGALAPSLAAADLFGAVRGAYTGATDGRSGSFVQADGGTLFLDEIGEAPPDVQVALLRTLETGEVRPLGASKPRLVDVRLVAATDADLERRIAEGRFSEPLFHRLAGYEVLLPPLRDRRDDIGRLLVHFLRQRADALGDTRFDDASEPWIEPGLMARLTGFDWPGNVRQLRNVAHQLAIGNRGRSPIRSVPAIDRLLSGPQPTAQSDRGEDAEPVAADESARRPAELTDDEILTAMRRERYQVKKAADTLGISRAALYQRIEKSALLPTAGQLDPKTVRRAHRELGGDLDALVERLEVSRFALRRRLRELGL